MPRNLTLEPPPVDDAVKEQGGSSRGTQPAAATTNESAIAAPQALRARSWLHEALLENSDTRPKKRTIDWVASIVIHTLFIAILILLPLYFTEAIDLTAFTKTFLVAPPPPPPPPPPAAPVIARISSAPKRVFEMSGKLIAPTVIPKQVTMIKESQDLAPDVGFGVPGGVPGGVAGGTAGGVIGGIISSAPKTYIPPAPTPTQKAPVRVGGRVLPPKLLSAPDPIYPPLAKQARVQGDVVIDAVIDTQGNVVEMQVVSGHPMLIQAALDALRRWRYQPTILNDEPTPVQLYVTVRFRIN